MSHWTLHQATRGRTAIRGCTCRCNHRTGVGHGLCRFHPAAHLHPAGHGPLLYDDPTQLIPGRVAGYTRTNDGYANAAYMSMTQPYAASALASSVDDLAKWDAALYTNEFVKPATLRRMFKSVVLADRQRRRLWLWLECRRL